MFEKSVSLEVSVRRKERVSGCVNISQSSQPSLSLCGGRAHAMDCVAVTVAMAVAVAVAWAVAVMVAAAAVVAACGS